MTNDGDFQTATMAKVYADQGHYEKAVEIYRVLLSRQPHRRDLAAALSEVEEKLAAGRSRAEAELTTLFEQWIELLLRYKRLRQLKRLRSRLL